MLLVNATTMVPAILIARERPGWRKSSSEPVDWAMLKDIPFLLMAAGMKSRIPEVITSLLLTITVTKNVGMFFSFWGVYFGFYFVSIPSKPFLIVPVFDHAQIASFAQNVLRMTTSMSFNLLIAMNTTNMVGRFIPGLISDGCIGPLNTLIPTAFISSILIFLWTGVTTQNGLFLIGCFYGFAAAGIQSLYLAVVFSFVSRNRENAPTRIAFVFVLIAIATLTGAPLGGHLITVDHGEYLSAEIFAGVSLLIGGTLFLAARLLKRGWQPEKL